MQEKNVASWIRIGSYVAIVIFMISDYTSNPDPSRAEALGATLWTLIGGIIGIACGNKCSKWSIKIEKSPNVAYVFGFVFSLLGLLIYWIYYKIKSKKNA